MLEKIVIVIGVSLDIVNSSIHKRERESERGGEGRGGKEREREKEETYMKMHFLFYITYTCLAYSCLRTSAQVYDAYVM